MRKIDYELLAHATSYYRREGYAQVEVPWLVKPIIDDMTRPHDVREFSVPSLGLHLCASGEQGFLQSLSEHGFTLDKKYFTVTPCFRDNEEDDVHQLQFMKLELGLFTRKREYVGKYTDELMNTARFLFNNESPATVSSVITDIGMDLRGKLKPGYSSDSVELGSYGYRVVNDGYWIYGTGLALPRFSYYKDRA